MKFPACSLLVEASVALTGLLPAATPAWPGIRLRV